MGTDTFEAIATDGVPGHEAHALINVNVVNDPPEITCPTLVAREDTPLDDPGRRPACTDPNGDPLTVDLDIRDGRHRRARRGHVALRARRATAPLPAPSCCSADDGDLKAVPQIISVTIVERRRARSPST